MLIILKDRSEGGELLIDLNLNTDSSSLLIEYPILINRRQYKLISNFKFYPCSL